MAYMQSLGLDIASLINTGGPAIQAASKVISDPALPEITCNILRLNKVVAGQDPGPACAKRVYTAAQKRQGVGLSIAVVPLRVAVWARKNPALAIAAGASVVGLIGYIGYSIGKR